MKSYTESRRVNISKKAIKDALYATTDKTLWAIAFASNTTGIADEKEEGESFAERRLDSVEAVMQYYGKDSGPYEAELAGHDVHVKTSPQEVYEEYNKGIPTIGHFIPAGFFETHEEYVNRLNQVKELTKLWEYQDVVTCVTKFWIPRTAFKSYKHWLSNQIIPRLYSLNPDNLIDEKVLTKFIIGWLVDVGWDPMHSWICLPPEEPYEDIKYVVDGMWDMLNHSTPNRIKNEYLQLFHNNPHRYVQFCDIVDMSIPHSNEAEFLIDREKTMIAHLVWLAKTDVRVYDHFRKRLIRKIDHKIARSMAINDPLMPVEDRFQRDLMLISAPVRNHYCDRNEGHNRMRDSMVGEYVPSPNAEEVRDGLYNFYFREENCFMENYLKLRYAYFMDHRDKAVAMVDTMVDLPVKIARVINQMYGDYDYEMIATIVEAAHNCYRKDVKKPRWSKADCIKHTLEMLRDIYPHVVKVQGMLDPDGYETMIDENHINLIGAIRVIFSNSDAKEEFTRMARRFGDQDPKYNDKIVELMTDIAMDVINQTEVNTKFGRKNPQHVLLRRDQPRNPRNLVTNYFDRYMDSEEFGNDRYDVVTNEDDVSGHRNRKKYTVKREKIARHDAEMEQLSDMRRIMKDYKVGHLNDAAERYLPDLEAHKLNYSGMSDRDIAKDKRKRSSKDVLEKYELDEPVEEENPIETATEDDLVDVAAEHFTKIGQLYVVELIKKFDQLAPAKYGKSIDKMKAARLETLRRAVGGIIESGDPKYLVDGNGEEDSFEPEDIRMTADRIKLMVQQMNTNQLYDFIDEYIDDRDKINLADVANDKRYGLDGVKTILINNADDLAKMYNYQNGIEAPDDDEDDDESEDLYEVVETNIEEEDEDDDYIPLERRKKGVHFDFDGGNTRKTGLESLIKKAPVTRESDLEEEKSQFFQWMINNVAGVDPDELNVVLNKMSDLDLTKFKHAVKDEIAKGSLKLIDQDEDEDDDDESSYGNYSNKIGNMRSIKHHNVEEEEDEEDDDDEAVNRRFKKLLYSC